MESARRPDSAPGGRNPRSSSPLRPASSSRASDEATTPPEQQGRSIDDLFLTAVGLTPEGLGAATLSSGGSVGEAEEEYWSATNEQEEKVGAGDTGGRDAEYGSSITTREQEQQSSAAGSVTIERGLFHPRCNDDGNVPSTGSDTRTEAVRSHSGIAVDGRDFFFNKNAGENSQMSESCAQQQRLSEADLGWRYPNETSNHPAENASGDRTAGTSHVATVAEGTARRRRILLGSNTAGPESESRPSRFRPSSAAELRIFSRGSSFRRSGDRGPFWRPNVVAGSATFDDEDDEDDDEDGEDTVAGTRAVELAINTSLASTAATAGGRATAAVAGDESNGRGDVGNCLDASERGDGGDGGQGRILFYHKPTLSNVPAGDIPDVVPVYLGCPRGNVALGLPLDEAWQGEEQQDTTFDQNMSYTILSWPEDHVQDLLELFRLQVLFFTTIIFNILVSGLLYFSDNPDRTRVEGFARPSAFPGPFQQRSPVDDPTGVRSEEWHLAAALLLSLLGMVCVLARIRAGIALYLVLTVVNAVVGLSHSPSPLFACRFAVDVVLVAIGRSYLSSLTYTWVTASAGDGRWGW